MSKLCSSRIIRPTEFAKRLGISKPTLWRWERAGRLPPKHQVGPNAVGWLESEIEIWWASRDATDSEALKGG